MSLQDFGSFVRIDSWSLTISRHINDVSLFSLQTIVQSVLVPAMGERIQAYVIYHK